MTIELSKDRISQLKLLVIGDTIIDHYVYCTAKELSREAPIPILNYQSEKYTLGGAGNLIANLFGLGNERGICENGTTNTDY